MYRKILVIVLVSIAVVFAGCGTTPSPTPTPSEMVNLESPLYIIEGENQVEGFRDFCEELEFLYEHVGLLGGYPLTEVEEYLEMAKECNSILIISPTSEGIQEFRDLENKYPDLCPISCDELESEIESHSLPLIYFSQDIGAEKLRGIIVASQVDPSLAKLLSEGVLLDIPFRYENGLLILE